MNEKTTTLLAIESSCDETGVSVVRKTGLPTGQAGRKKNWKDVDAIARVSIEIFSLIQMRPCL